FPTLRWFQPALVRGFHGLASLATPVLLFSLGFAYQFEQVCIECLRIAEFLIPGTIARHPDGCIHHVAMTVPMMTRALLVHVLARLIAIGRSRYLDGVRRCGRWRAGRRIGRAAQRHSGGQGGNLGGVGEYFFHEDSFWSVGSFIV